MKKRIAAFIPVVLASSFAFAGVPGHVAASTSEVNKVVDFETIIGSLDVDGSLKRVRLVDDLRVFGTGDIVITDPTATGEIRNLLGFSSPQIEGDAVRYEIQGLDGSAQFLTAATPDKDPPLSMAVTYALDGENLDGGDLVGKSGNVEITFSVRNDTVRKQTVTFKDGTGKEQDAVLNVPVPIVAQLQLMLPPDHFTQVDAPGADVFTDPTGNKIVNWSMVMVPPIGETAQTFTLKARAEDFRLGQIRLIGAPVAPKERPFLNYAEEQLGGGVEQASSLYAGATEIGANMDKLHDGTIQLLDGMEKLFAGSQKLTAGLLQAFDGSGQLTSGLNEAAAGSGKLTSGLGQIFDGAKQLADNKEGLPAAVAGVGTASDPATASLAGGVAALQSGLKLILGGLGQLKAGLPGAKDAANGIKQIAQGLAAGLTTGSSSIKGGADGIKTIAASLSTLLAGASQACAADPDGFCGGTQFTPGFTIKGALDFVAGCMTGATANACGPGTPSVSTIAGLISAGAAQIATCLAGGGINDCGVGAPSVTTVATLLVGGVDQALAGLGSPSTKNTLIWGTSQAYEGTGLLLDGLSQLRSGLQEAVSGIGSAGQEDTLLWGLDQAHAGSEKLTAGLRDQAAPGSQQLTDGLGLAHDGSGKITDGLGQAKGGTSQIEQGVYAINELGVKEVGRAANDTVIDIGQQLAMLKAQDHRAATESLLYGPPSSDQAQTVVGGSGIVLILDALDGRDSATASRGLYAGLVFLLLLGLGWFGARAIKRQGA